MGREQSRRLTLLVGAIVLVDTMFYAAIAPLLPHYTDELGLTKTEAGVLTAAYPVGTLLGSVPAGWVAARLGPRPVLLTGLATLAASSVAFGLAPDAATLDLARLAQGLGGAAAWAAGLAWLVAAAPAERRGSLIGGAMSAAIGGELLGPLLGTAGAAAGPLPIFSAVAAAAAVLAACVLATPGPSRRHDSPPARGVVGDPAIRLALWLVALPALSFGAITVLGPLRLDALGASPALLGGTFVVAAAVQAVLSPVVGAASDRRGRLGPLRIGLAAAAVVVPALALPTSSWSLAGAVVVASVTLGVLYTPAIALLSDASESIGLPQSLAFALMNIGWASGQAVGAGVGARTSALAGDGVVYVALGVGALLTLLVSAPRRRARGAGGPALTSAGADG